MAQLAALAHDLEEAITGDLPSPIKKDLTGLEKYEAILCGFFNYYSFVDNYSHLNQIMAIFKSSSVCGGDGWLSANNASVKNNSESSEMALDKIFMISSFLKYNY